MSSLKKLLAVTLLTLGASAATAEEGNRLAVAIGTPGSESFTFGTELWAMSQIALLPTHGISLDQREVTADEDRLTLLQDRDVEAALVYGRVPNAYDNDVRAVMALWPGGVSSDDADPVQFLVHKDVDAEVIYLLTKAVFEHANYFRNAHASLGIGPPSEAMKGLDIPLHAGAFRYFDEKGFGLEEAVAADYWERDKKGGESQATERVVSYHNFDDDALAPEEIEQIAAACRQALEMGSLSVVLGDLDNTGCEVYQDRLTDAGDGQSEPDSDNPQPVTALKQPAATDGDSAFEGTVGQGGPAIRLAPSEVETTGAAGQAQKARIARQPVM